MSLTVTIIIATTTTTRGLLFALLAKLRQVQVSGSVEDSRTARKHRSQRRGRQRGKTHLRRVAIIIALLFDSPYIFFTTLSLISSTSAFVTDWFGSVMFFEYQSPLPNHASGFVSFTPQRITNG
jgi:hypothetical protein